MQDRLRQRYQVYKEVSRRGYFEGGISLADLKRLSKMLVSDEGEIMVNFEFEMSDYSKPKVFGQITANLLVECQRCLQPMTQDVKIDFCLLVDAADDLVRVSELDTLYSEDGHIDIFEVVEDEIILALPLVVMHDNESCNEHWRIADTNQESETNENPFSILKELKTTH